MGRSLSECSVYIALLIILMGYTYEGGILSSDKVFVTLYILNLVKYNGLQYLNNFHLYKINLDVITIRITEILLLTELKEK
jgi:hypothetical protein